MIKHLYIKNFVLIDELQLDFQDGFSVFTGETGAGKSILIDAISLLRAERAASSYIRKGCDEAVIEGTFDLQDDPAACMILNAAGFELEDETTFTRTLHANGKSSARIDHRSVTLSLMKKALQNQIDIHGQRDNAYLLDKSTHVHLLDAYINQEDKVNEVKEAYQNYASLLKEKQNLLEHELNESDLDYYQYEINEINQANLKPGEDEELERKEKQYKAVKESMEKLQMIQQLYDNSIADPFSELNHMVQSLKADDTISKIQTSINDAYYSFTDAMESLNALSSDEMMSEDEINAMEERLYTIQKLKRKYGHSIQDILDKKEELQKKADVYANRQETLDQIDQMIDRAEKKYDQCAGELSKLRHSCADQLDRAVENNLKDLMLKNARFKTVIQAEKEPTVHGKDNVEFMISMNKGMPLSPLNKTASGGELSRLMLGLKCIFTRLQGIRTVIFDEIDTGVSGPVATAIGHKMHDLSRDCQVFAVTHLAQVAACGDHHYFVSKTSEEDETVSRVSELNEEERIDQLALIANGTITDTSRKAAMELYRRNQY